MRRVVFSLLILAASLVPNVAAAQRLFVLVAADTTDEALREGVQRNMEWIRDAFYANVPKDHLLVRFLEGESLTSTSLAASVAGCPVQPDDAVVVWWLGRGEFEGDRRVLVMPDGTRLESAALRDQVVARSPRLSVMVIDAASRTLPVIEVPEKTMEMAPAVNLNPVFRSLFFVPCGSIEIDSASANQRPLMMTRIGGLLTAGLVLPPGALGDVGDEAGYVNMTTPSGERELVLERGLLWRDINESVEWDTVLAQLRSVTSANYRRALGSKHSGTGQTPTYGETRLKYADHFVEWQAAFGEFRSRPRASRVRTDGDREVTWQGDREMPPADSVNEAAGSGVVAIEGPQADGANDVGMDSPLAESDFQIIPGDHLVEINGRPVRNAEEFEAAMQAVMSKPGKVQFVVIDNRTGQQIHYTTHLDPQKDRDFGITPWCWKDTHVIVHEVLPGSPAERAKAIGLSDPALPEEVGLGIRGGLVRFDDPFREGERIVGVQVKEVTDPERSNLKPGDIVFDIDGCNFANAEGYHYALRNARQVAAIWYVGAGTGKVEHGHVTLPHTPPKEYAEPPEGAMTLSITPEIDNSCPIW